MKRTRLKPGKALKATKSLLRTGTLKRVGKRKQREQEQYGQWRRDYLAAHPWCQVCLILAEAGIVLNPRPLHRADACHERQKRSAGGALNQEVNILSACNHSNGWIEENPMRSRKLGLTVYSWEDPATVDIPELEW